MAKSDLFRSKFPPPPRFGLTERDPEGVLLERAYGTDELLVYLEH